MKLPKKLLHPKLNEQQLIALLEKIQQDKEKAIANKEYERAAMLRDQARKYTAQLEDLMNPPVNEENKDGQ